MSIFENSVRGGSFILETKQYKNKEQQNYKTAELGILRLLRNSFVPPSVGRKESGKLCAAQVFLFRDETKGGRMNNEYTLSQYQVCNKFTYII